MLDVKERLLRIVDLVLDRLSFLEGCGYQRTAPELENMQATGRFVPDMPYVEMAWVDDAACRSISVTVYSNYVVFCKVRDTASGRSLDMIDYVRSKFGKDTGVHSMPGGAVENKFLSFLQLIGDELRADVLTREDLPNIPIDWQGHK